ncbi:MAG: hypothetical protein FWH04_04365 [Oscillospiraceae bacterium]|nr:hypothetical protein [Oscillospiraceae bacterium]
MKDRKHARKLTALTLTLTILTLALIVVLTLMTRALLAEANDVDEQENMDGVVQIVAGYVHSAALKSDGTLWTWGFNSNGQLGDGTTKDRAFPAKVGKDTDWKSVSAGAWHTVALKSNGSIWAWGNNEEGQVGNGTGGKVKDKQLLPVQSGPDTDWASVAAGTACNYAIKTNGTLWAWGVQCYGLWSGGDEMLRTLTPIQIGTDDDWASISVSTNNVMGLKTNGTLWAWGDNWSGEHGNGTRQDPSLLPIQVGTDTDWANFTLSSDSVVALKANGSLWGWGENVRTDNSAMTYILSPTQLGTDTDWVSISQNSGSSHHYMAIKTDGSLWAWGNNYHGQVSSNKKVIGEPLPVRFGTDTGWVSASAGGYSSFALKDDGTIWSWGENSNGELGDGTTKNRTTPMKLELRAFSSDCCIDYTATATDVIVKSSGTPTINLTNDSISFNGFVPLQFEVGDGKWKNIADNFTNQAKFAKLFDKDITLTLKSASETVVFPKINKRPPAPKLVVNYEVAADSTGNTPGEWVLTDKVKKGQTPEVNKDVQIGLALVVDPLKNKFGKTVDADGWGKFFPGATDGICVRAMGTKNGKPAVMKTTYFYREAAKPNGDGTYTAASKSKKLSVAGEQKPTKYKPGAGKAKSDSTYVNDTLYAKKASLALNSGDVIWHGATAKKAATAKQIIT